MGYIIVSFADNLPSEMWISQLEETDMSTVPQPLQ